MATERLLTADEVAKRARVNVRTVWRWEATGLLPSVRIEGARFVRFRRSDVEELLTPVYRIIPPASSAS